MMFCMNHMAEADDDSCDHEYADSPCEVRDVAMVALDGIDVEELREVMANGTLTQRAPSLHEWAVVMDVAHAYLAAIDQEDTDGS